MTTDNGTASGRALKCPGCDSTVQWSDDFPYRPFCSKRCRDGDFIDWANEEKRIAGNPAYDDIFSEGRE